MRDDFFSLYVAHGCANTVSAQYQASEVNVAVTLQILDLRTNRISTSPERSDTKARATSTSLMRTFEFDASGQRGRRCMSGQEVAR